MLFSFTEPESIQVNTSQYRRSRKFALRRFLYALICNVCKELRWNQAQFLSQFEKLHWQAASTEPYPTFRNLLVGGDF